MDKVESTSLDKDFELILDQDGISQKFSLYKERRFTKLGYTAGAIVDCIPQFEKLLNSTNCSNLVASLSPVSGIWLCYFCIENT